MSKFEVTMLATAPGQIYLIWTATWLALDAIRHRSTARAAAAEANASVRHASPPPDRITTHERNREHDTCIPRPDCASF